MSRRLALLLLGLSACRPAPASESATPANEPAPASVVQVHGCVTIDRAPAPQAAVKLSIPDGESEPVTLDAGGCFRLERPVGAPNRLIVSAPGRGTIFQPLLPVAGALELELPLPPASRFIAATIRSRDRASRLADLAGWYASQVRLSPAREHLQDVERRLRAETDPVVRAALGVVYLVLARMPKSPAGPADPALLEAVVADLPPTHLAWSIEMEAIVLAASAGDVDHTYLRRVLDGHADPQVYAAAAYVLAGASAQAKDPDGVRTVLARLRERGGSSVFAKLAFAYDPDDHVVEGQPLPPFRLRRLDGDGVVESDALRGKVFVLHIWATWCKPCVEQIPALTELHTRHAADGLEIVSLTTDEDPQTVVAFRRDRHAMPWLHAWEPPAVAEDLSRAYQVVGASKTIIVGRDGNVIAEHLHPGEPEFAARIVDALTPRR